VGTLSRLKKFMPLWLTMPLGLVIFGLLFEFTIFVNFRLILI
jgi:hypothetical protein